MLSALWIFGLVDSPAAGAAPVVLPPNNALTAEQLGVIVNDDDQLSVAIPNSPTGVTGTQGQRASSSVQVDVSGFDNTRTMGALSFTFYDSSGNVLPSGSIQTNAAGDFSKYFAGSDLGGAFVLHAVFTVTGDTSRIASCDVTLTNSAGTTKAPRISF